MESLQIHTSSIGDEGLQRLRELNGLKRLSLSGCAKVSDAGLVHLQGLTQLTELHLEGASLSDAGLVHLQGLTELTKLRLDGAPISDAGLLHLEDVPQLRVADIGNGTNVSRAGRQRLQAVLAKREMERRAGLVAGMEE
ncbi:MAG: hypothetical protein WD403_12440 [Pirellulales bacterium]